MAIHGFRTGRSTVGGDHAGRFCNHAGVVEGDDTCIPCPFCKEWLIGGFDVIGRTAESTVQGKTFHYSPCPAGTRPLFCATCEVEFSTRMSDVEYREAVSV